MGRLVLLGSKSSGLVVLRTMLKAVGGRHEIAGVICPRDERDGRSKAQDFVKTAHENCVPISFVSSSDELDECFSKTKPDIVLVCGWYQLIDVSKYSEIQFYGFHYSALPKYRGNAPLVWQIIFGEPEVGVTFFNIGEGVDDGDIVDQGFVSLGENETISHAIDKLEAVVGLMVLENLNGLMDGSVVLRKQDHSKATYCGLRTPDDGRIQWELGAKSVHDFIRAQSKPYPGAFCYLANGKKIIILESELDPRSYIGVPGGVAEIAGDAVVITCGEGAVRIKMVEIEGEDQTEATKILRSIKDRLQ